MRIKRVFTCALLMLATLAYLSGVCRRFAERETFNPVHIINGKVWDVCIGG